MARHPRCGTFVLAGRPNTGKSTLLNCLVGENLAIISAKPQSTRQPVIGVRTEKDTQLLFVDPPGLLEPKYLLQHAMLHQALEQLRLANGILYLHPAGEGEPPPLASLIPPSLRITAPVLTVLTKADLTSSERGLDTPSTPAPRASKASVPLRVSAVTGLGIDELIAWCRAHAPVGPFHCDPDDVSNQPLRFFAAEFVREAAFAVLGEELPYAVAAEVEEFRECREPVYIRVSLYVERESQKGMVIGSGGRTIKALGKLARNKIEALLGNRVYLDLWVKVLPKWRTTPQTLRQLGFPTPAGRKR
jgi:GTP-binding protein Era